MSGRLSYSFRPVGELTINHDSQRRPVKAAERHSGPYPYYGAQGVVDHVDHFLFDGEFLLVAEDGENLRSRKEAIAILARGRFWVNNHAHVLQGNSDANTRFLLYAINVVDISGYITGSTIPKLSQGSLNRILVPCPPICEQRAIASVLSALDDKIDLNRRMNETLEAMARAIFKDWFVDFGPTRAKTEGRSPYLAPKVWALFPDRLDDDEKPQRWILDRLGTFTELQNGYAFKSNDWQNAGIPVVKIGSIKPSVVDLTQVSYVSPIIAKDRAAFQLGVGDVLVGLTGYVGETGRIPPTENAPLLNQRVGRFSSSGRFSQFVFACVREPSFKTYAEGKAHGSAQPNVSTRDLLDYPVINPGQPIFQAFETLTAPLFARCLANFGENTVLAQTRDLLLPKLMSGEIRIRDAEKAVAELV